MGFTVLDDVVKTTGSLVVVNMVKLTDMLTPQPLKTVISPIFAHLLYVRPNLYSTSGIH